ncbi:hypothetical protein WJX73_004382 [Symbiochloris irregularis]|uniref:Protein kinase domain-containing protein n=1 Tax=Symbiochloris irregularis TaxID=706552 RepID=A0AAW1PI47_9CHLO
MHAVAAGLAAAGVLAVVKVIGGRRFPIPRRRRRAAAGPAQGDHGDQVPEPARQPDGPDPEAAAVRQAQPNAVQDNTEGAPAQARQVVPWHGRQAGLFNHPARFMGAAGPQTAARGGPSSGAAAASGAGQACEVDSREIRVEEADEDGVFGAEAPSDVYRGARSTEHLLGALRAESQKEAEDLLWADIKEAGRQGLQLLEAAEARTQSQSQLIAAQDSLLQTAKAGRALALLQAGRQLPQRGDECLAVTTACGPRQTLSLNCFVADSLAGEIAGMHLLCAIYLDASGVEIRVLLKLTKEVSEEGLTLGGHSALSRLCTETLQHYLRHNGPLSQDLAGVVMAEVLAALSHLHARAWFLRRLSAQDVVVATMDGRTISQVWVTNVWGAACLPTRGPPELTMHGTSAEAAACADLHTWAEMAMEVMLPGWQSQASEPVAQLSPQWLRVMGAVFSTKCPSAAAVLSKMCSEGMTSRPAAPAPAVAPPFGQQHYTAPSYERGYDLAACAAYLGNAWGKKGGQLGGEGPQDRPAPERPRFSCDEAAQRSLVSAASSGGGKTPSGRALSVGGMLSLASSRPRGVQACASTAHSATKPGWPPCRGCNVVQTAWPAAGGASAQQWKGAGLQGRTTKAHLLGTSPHSDQSMCAEVTQDSMA